MGGISIWQLLIIFAIIVLLFGTKKLRNIGADLGGAVKGFKKSMSDDEKSDDATSEIPAAPNAALKTEHGAAKSNTEQSTKKETHTS